jgi:TetR/AcrR family transcriptional regulator, repressor for uid operon
MAKRKSSEDKRAKIRHAAYICFRENGYHQTSIDEICESAGISKGSFYWHYGAKIDVFVDILEFWTREVVDELLGQFEDATMSPDRFSQLGLAFDREFHRARAIVPLWAEFALHARRDREIQVALAKFFRRARAAIAEILRQSAFDRLSEQQILGTAAMILGAYSGIILQEMSDPSQNAASWSRSFLGVLDGLLREGTEKRPEEGIVRGARLSKARLEEFLGGESPSEFWLLRARILRCAPHSDEKVIRGWGVVAYNHGGLVCHLKLRPQGVELAFYRGDLLSDPCGLLRSAGKKRRVYLLQSSEDAPKELDGLISAAFSTVDTA